ncbi:DMT family transporter [Tomitella fengzijianii]|uniref:QacE family quaternary ammonium compound efflux SMR transporter n=1 Tax=Tomitella fengzijianii TaxID=2597660 RepID=A0A516WYW8_9ACTN|nr:SMR family transporter [Tomitella fengzijianii]QDQ96036.1 QacE family quaternary ammonium compound efflux SMR transporter [Tomitella fengzijianii]
MAGVWLAAAIAAELFATLSLRASRGLVKKAWLVPVVSGYVLAFGFLGGALRAGMSIGVAYGIWTAAGIAMVALLARAIWGDPLTRRMLVGIGVIAAGVVLVEAG